VDELGRQLADDYRATEPILLGVLTGAFVFLADLLRAMPIPVGCGMMAVTSYGAGTRTTGVVRVRAAPSVPIGGRDVVLVDDIADSGRTLAHLLGYLEGFGPRTLRTCVLLDKPSRREVPVTPDYVGFRIADRFVVGCGLDADGLYRNLPDLHVLDGIAGPDQRSVDRVL
jgi:hypoxanthine phosphoribosyltransferase